MSKFVLKVSKREPMIEYRPHSHNKLHVNNGIFDLSYSAYLWCKSIVENKYMKIVHECFAYPPWLHEIICSQRQIDAPTVCFVESGLSDYDRVTAFETLHGNIEAHSDDVVKIDINKSECANITTCQQLISHVLTALLLQPQISSVVKKYSKLTSIDQIDNMFLLSKAVESFEILFDIIEQSMMNANPDMDGMHIVITIGFIEGISPDAFNQFLQFLKEQNRPVTLLLCCNMANIDQYEHCEHMRFGLRVIHQTTISSHALFQRIFEEIIVSGDLPVIIPCGLLKHLYDEFTMLTCCSRTFTRRLLSLLHHHFYQRKALLAMCSQVGWIKKMNLDTGAAMDTTVRKILKIITFVDVKELGEVSVDEETKRFSMPKVQNHVERIWDFQQLARHTLQLLNVFMQSLPQDHLQKQKFTSANLWFGLFDETWRPRKSRLMNDLHGLVTSTVSILSFGQLQSLIDHLNNFISQTTALEWHTHLAKLQWRDISRHIGRLHRCMTALALLLSRLPPRSDSKDVNSWTLAELKRFCQELRNDGNFNKDGEVGMVAVDVSAVFAVTLSKPNPTLDSTVSMVPAPTETAEEKELNGGDAINVNNEDTVPVTSDPSPIKRSEYSPSLLAAVIKWFPEETRSTATSLSVPLSVLWQGLIDDTVASCSMVLDRFLRWPLEYVGWEGVFVMDDSALRYYLEDLSGDLRQRFQESLSRPEDWLLRVSETASIVAPATELDPAMVEEDLTTNKAEPNVKSSNKRKSKRKFDDDADIASTAASLAPAKTRKLPPHVHTPDVCLLLSKAQSAAMVEPFHLWYEAFVSAVYDDEDAKRRQLLQQQQASAETQGAAGEKAHKKKPKKSISFAADTTLSAGDTGTDIASVSRAATAADLPTKDNFLQMAYANKSLRVRFFHALYQLEKSGWISTSYTERMGIRVTRHFFVGM